ncbi:inorganic diphosphatase [Bdellovibrio sp. NC01]|uniref:inorganic diphosphatase n=1 Tax=Bdellovibrio sp. NC01 TaxID=2220073 RepID=UPI00115AAADE|nr:inorganic diphosphatase [Bdellovibrio sp. NC01]QDK37765.1 inorganic diphosphatase [Bdellovibrio sp. NC01]
MNAWHDIELGKNAPEVVNAIIEIPRFSKTKFELDKESGLLKVDRVLYSSVHYPANYGFIPRTYSDDKDPLDILVFGQADVYPLSIMQARPIGYMRMFDQDEIDDKIISVHADDPEMAEVHSISDLAPHTLKEIQNFFEIYKGLENKKVSVEGFKDKPEAIKIIRQAMGDYQAHFKTK